MSDTGELTYGSYLRLDDLLSCQSPRTDSHDELLFVVIHQVYELWFKQILHETGLLQSRLESGNGGGALATARRIAKILKTVVGQLDILETMTPRQFASFRPDLGGSSGFQSYQFRYLEAVLGRRDFPSVVVDGELDSYMSRRPVFGSLLRYLRQSGYVIPGDVLDRDPRLPWEPDERVGAVLADVYAQTSPATPAPSGTSAPSATRATSGTSGPSATLAASEAAEVCEALVDIDEGVQEWRYRHVKMVERIIGAKLGTGGSTGADYLRRTLFRPAFPDLWDIRSRL
jgi:tryptophan 2,3-dioxygenase